MERVVKVNSEAEMLRLARIEYDNATDDQTKLQCLIAVLMDEVAKTRDVENFHRIRELIANLAACDRVSFEAYLDAGKLAGAAMQNHDRVCRRSKTGIKH